MQEFEKRAQAIGGPIATALPKFLIKASANQRNAHTVCVGAVLDAVKAQPELNDTEFVDSLLRQSLDYTTGAAPVAFQQALLIALEHCPPQGVKLAVAFPEGEGSIKRGNHAAMRPGVCDSLTIMAELAKADVFPETEAALLNCYRQLMNESVPWIATRAVARVIQGNVAVFKRAAAGESMAQG